MKTSNLMAFLGGVTVGAVVALLLAPEKGCETRKKIKETLENEIDKLKEKLNISEILDEIEEKLD